MHHGNCIYFTMYNYIIIAKYCPIKEGCLCTSVVGFGLTGVWRMRHMDYTSCDEDVYLELIKESHVFQPENHGYYLCELTEGKLHHIIEVLVSCNDVEHK